MQNTIKNNKMQLKSTNKDDVVNMKNNYKVPDKRHRNQLVL